MKIENKKAKDNETLYYIIMWRIFAFKSSNRKVSASSPAHVQVKKPCGISDSVVILM